SVYEAVKGNRSAAAASLDSMARDVRPPEPQMARMPRTGTNLTHRVAVIIGGDPLPLGSGWPAAPTPRAQAEVFLDGWVGMLLGDSRTVRARVAFTDPSGQLQERLVTLADLALRPLDLVALARGVSELPHESEIDRRLVA